MNQIVANEVDRIVANEVICQKFMVVDSIGNIAAVVDTDDEGGGRVAVFREGKPAAIVDTDTYGGCITVVKDEKPAVKVEADSDSGRVTVFRDGKPSVLVDAGPDGGKVTVQDRYGKIMILIFVDDDGEGCMATFRNDGEIRTSV